MKAGATWWAQTRASNLAHEVRATLLNRARGHVLAVFKRGTRAAAYKGRREAANLRNKGELDPVGQFWSGWLGAEACGAEITSGPRTGSCLSTWMIAQPERQP